MARKASREKTSISNVRKKRNTEIVIPQKSAVDVTPEEQMPDVTFKCKFCGADKPLSEMRVLTKYFPPVVLCKDCEKGE